MLTRTTSKGNKTQDKGIIPFYTKEAFPDTVEKDDEVKEPKKVTIRLKLDESKESSRENCFMKEIRLIENFHLKDENIEHVLEIIELIQHEVMAQAVISDDLDKIRKFHNYINVALGTTASRQWHEFQLKAKSDITSDYTKVSDTESFHLSKAEQTKMITTKEAFQTWVDAKSNATQRELNMNNVTTGAGLKTKLIEAYHYRVMDYMNLKVFGQEKSCEALDDQIDYLAHKIVKPFGVGVEATMERIEHLITLLKYFPPTTIKDEFPTVQAHKEHENFEITEAKKRKIFFNVLPEESFQLKITCECEVNYTAMTNEQFLSTCLRFEKADQIMREKKLRMQKNNDKRKKDSTSNMSRTDRNRNDAAKKRRTDQNDKNAKGVALHCVFCEENGAPKWVYQNHTTDKCRKKNQSERKLSGNSTSRNAYQKDAKKELRALKKKYKKLKVSERELRVTKKTQRRTSFKSESSTQSCSDDEGSHASDSDQS
eukprot:62403_1